MANKTGSVPLSPRIEKCSRIGCNAPATADLVIVNSRDPAFDGKRMPVCQTHLVDGIHDAKAYGATVI